MAYKHITLIFTLIYDDRKASIDFLSKLRDTAFGFHKLKGKINKFPTKTPGHSVMPVSTATRCITKMERVGARVQVRLWHHHPASQLKSCYLYFQSGSLLIQLGKVGQVDPSTWASVPTRRLQGRHRLLASTWISTSHWEDLRGKLGDGDHCHFLPFSVILPIR